MRFDQRFDDRQTQPGSAPFDGHLGVELAEWRQRDVESRRGHPDAGILHAERKRGIGVALRKQRHPAPGPGEFNGIRQQIGEDLLECALVADKQYPELEFRLHPGPRPFRPAS